MDALTPAASPGADNPYLAWTRNATHPPELRESALNAISPFDIDDGGITFVVLVNSCLFILSLGFWLFTRERKPVGLETQLISAADAVQEEDSASVRARAATESVRRASGEYGRVDQLIDLADGFDTDDNGESEMIEGPGETSAHLASSRPRTITTIAAKRKAAQKIGKLMHESSLADMKDDEAVDEFEALTARMAASTRIRTLSVALEDSKSPGYIGATRKRTKSRAGTQQTQTAGRKKSKSAVPAASVPVPSLSRSNRSKVMQSGRMKLDGRRRDYLQLAAEGINAAELREIVKGAALDSSTERNFSSFFGGFRCVWDATDAVILKRAGIDASLYLQFWRQVIILLTFVSVLDLAIILPINLTGSVKLTGFSSTTVSNLDGYATEPELLWAHAIVNAISAAAIYFFVYRFSRLRKDLVNSAAYTSSPAASRTAWLYNLPHSVTHTVLRRYLALLFPELSVYSVHITMDTSKLRPIVSQWKSRAAELRVREMKLDFVAEVKKTLEPGNEEMAGLLAVEQEHKHAVNVCAVRLADVEGKLLHWMDDVEQQQRILERGDVPKRNYTYKYQHARMSS